MNDPGCKDRFDAEYRQIPVDKKNRLLAVYPPTKEGTRLLSEIDKKDRAWILFAALCYEQPVVLQPIKRMLHQHFLK